MAPYDLPLQRQMGWPQYNSFRPHFSQVKAFESREGEVQLSRSKASGKLRIIKTVRHRGPRPPPEAHMLSLLADTHPNIVTVFAATQESIMKAAVVMEYCDGGTVDDQVARFKKLGMSAIPKIFALHFMASMGDALAYLHHGLVNTKPRKYEKTSDHTCIVHRDIKPDNIFLRFDGRTPGLPTLVLADFGLSRFTLEAEAGSGCVPFMSPECLWGKGTLDHRSDIYSLGVTILDVLSMQKARWKTGSDPAKNAVLDEEYAGLGITGFLKEALQIRPDRRCEMSADGKRNGALWRIGDFWELRQDMIRKGKRLNAEVWKR